MIQHGRTHSGRCSETSERLKDVDGRDKPGHDSE
jgi:hypothetical protein